MIYIFYLPIKFPAAFFLALVFLSLQAAGVQEADSPLQEETRSSF